MEDPILCSWALLMEGEKESHGRRKREFYIAWTASINRRIDSPGRYQTQHSFKVEEFSQIHQRSNKEIKKENSYIYIGFRVGYTTSQGLFDKSLFLEGQAGYTKSTANVGREFVIGDAKLLF